MSDQLNGTLSLKTQPKIKKPKNNMTLKQRCLHFCKRDRPQDLTNIDIRQAPLRQVIVDTAKLPDHPQENEHYITNKITVLCSIPDFSPLPSYSAISPLAFVLAMSMMREAYEDYKRRKNDRITNNKKCNILINSGSEIRNQHQFDKTYSLNRLQQDPNERVTPKIKDYFKDRLWSQVKCGDLIYVQEGEHFPADAVFLMSSAENGECFVQTSTLDGERALKHKQCLVPIKKAIEKDGLLNFRANFHCEVPTKNLYEFNAFLESEQLPEYGTIQLSSGSKKRTITLDNKQLALRGSNLANTQWVIAAVIYTGKESKLMLNQGLSRFKQSKIEKVVNVICIYLIIIQTILCVIMSIYCGFYTANYSDRDSGSLKRKAEYLFYTELSAQSRSNSTSSDDDLIYNPTIVGFKTYGAYYILLNTLIPISLVVSIEFVKLIQTPFFSYDMQMYDEISMKQVQPMTMTLHEELASVKYIFADKTGTLTANIMQFKACSIGSVCYDEDYNDDDYEYMNETQRNLEKEENSVEEHLDQDKVIQEEQKYQDSLYLSGIDGDGEEKAQQFEQYKESVGYPFNPKEGESKLNRKDSLTKILWNYKESTQIIKNLLETKKYFMNDEINLGKSSKSGQSLILQKQNEYLHYFWLNVVLCHDVITTKRQNEDFLTYQGTSPDEITLLDAAKEVGYIFLDRNSQEMKISVFGVEKTYLLLQKLEFTSDRKKMTVIVKDQESGHVILFSKGADLAIFDKLAVTIEQPFLDATKEDLIKFSTKGFRTLCFAMRVLDETYFNNWQESYENSKLDMIKLGLGKFKIELHKENIQDKLLNELESELFLLGATALEDKLQEGVPESIEDFHNAGIKVWMLTGDKLETAENIGFSSKMFNEKMYIFKLQTKTKHDTRNRLSQIDAKILEIEKSHSMPIIGTQFLLNPNAGLGMPRDPQEIAQQYKYHDQAEARNIIQALEEFKHESKASEYTLNDSWARKPALRRKIRKRLEEIVPDKSAVVAQLLRENQLFYKMEGDSSKYIPKSFGMVPDQYIIRMSNVYRSQQSNHQKKSTEITDNEDTFGILIEGQTLQYLIDSETMKKKFLKILSKCQAVIVCRASPSQKGLVVSMIKHNEPEIVTLAIGDGANDVNMIQKAHIGIGIFGKEGYQAAASSDYAIGQFRYLRRLMFVHGRWSGIRLSVFMLFFFNKNIVFTLPQFWFGWYNGFSGQTFYDDAYLTSFNTFVTALAVCTLAIWDQDININDEKTAKMIDLFFPFLYKEAQEHELFSKKKFLVWAFISACQSILVFGVPVLTYQYLILKDGEMEDLWTISICSYYALVFIHYFLVLSFTKNWTPFILGFYIISFLFFTPFLTVTYNSFPNTFLEGRLGEMVYSNVYFWLIILVITVACIIPIYFYFNVQALLFPKLRDLILQNRLDQDKILNDLDPERARHTHELFKQRQQAQINQWNQDYNNFELPLEKGNISHSRIHDNNSPIKVSQLDISHEEYKANLSYNKNQITETPDRPSKLRKGVSTSKLLPNNKEFQTHKESSFQKKINQSKIIFEQAGEESPQRSLRINYSPRSENLDNISLKSFDNRISIKVQNYLEEYEVSPQRGNINIPLSNDKRHKPSKNRSEFI